MKNKFNQIVDFILQRLKNPRVILALLLIWYIEAPLIILVKKGFFSTNLTSLYLNPFKLVWEFISSLSVVIAFIKFNMLIVVLFIAICLLLHISGYKSEKIIEFKKLELLINIFREEEGHINFSKKGDCGTAKWIENESEVKQLTNIVEISSATPENKGLILGYLRDTNTLITLPQSSFLNKNCAILGSSGSMKSRSFVIPNIINLMNTGESMFITDPKGELLAKTSSILEKNGYEVKALNLNNIPCSNRWALLKEVHDQESAMIFAESIIQNTNKGGKSDKFWDDGQANLLKAIALYIMSDEYEGEANMTSLYKLITDKEGVDGLKSKFNGLGDDHIARMSWNIFNASAGNEKVSAGMLSGLATKLQILQSEQFQNLLNEEEIDLELPGKKKCAYFVVVPDSHSTFDFIAGLFFTFAFIKLTNFADKTAKHELPIHVNFLMDEFPNICKVPDFEKKISTVRSRGISVCIIFQAIPQLLNRYPDGKAEEILANCDTKIFLGANDNNTAEFISKSLGTATIETKSESSEKHTLKFFDGKVSSRLSNRSLLNIDEVLKQDPFHSVIMLRGKNPIKAQKMDYTKHSAAKDMEDVPIYLMLKDWSKKYHKKYLEDLLGVMETSEDESNDEEKMEVINKIKSLLDKINEEEELEKNKSIEEEKAVFEEIKSRNDEFIKFDNFINDIQTDSKKFIKEEHPIKIKKEIIDKVNIPEYIREKIHTIDAEVIIKALDETQIQQIKVMSMIIYIQDKLKNIAEEIDWIRSNAKNEWKNKELLVKINEISNNIRNKIKQRENMITRQDTGIRLIVLDAMINIRDIENARAISSRIDENVIDKPMQDIFKKLNNRMEKISESMNEDSDCETKVNGKLKNNEEDKEKNPNMRYNNDKKEVQSKQFTESIVIERIPKENNSVDYDNDMF